MYCISKRRRTIQCCYGWTMLGNGWNSLTFWHLLPVWFLVHPLWFEWSFEPDSKFFVNGEKQDIVYPASIHLSGFKGFGLTIYILLLKIYPLMFVGPLEEILSLPRTRVFGQCAEIVVYDST